MEEKTRAIYLADLDYFHAKLEETPESTYHLPVAAIYARLKKYEEVLSVSSKGLEVNPGHTQLQTLYAEAMINIGRKDEANEILYDVLMVDEDNYKALKLLGQIFKSDSDKENAVKFLRAAYLKSPEDDELVTSLEDMGENVSQIMLSAPKAVPENDLDFEDDEDVCNFNISTHISDAERVMSDVMHEMSNIKSATAATDGILPDDKKFAQESSDSPADSPVSNEVFQGQELTDDEILNALSKAKAHNESESLFNADEPVSSENSLADILGNQPHDINTLLAETEVSAPVMAESHDYEAPLIPEPQELESVSLDHDASVFMPEPPDLSELAPVNDDIDDLFSVSAVDLEAALGKIDSHEKDSDSHKIELHENNEVLLPEEPVNTLQDEELYNDAVPLAEDAAELEHDDLFFNLAEHEEFDERHDFAPEPFIPADLVQDVFKESGMDADAADDERITPESVKQEKEDENE